MCKVDVYGFNTNGDLKIHRKSYSHQMLREFLHPKCTSCQKEFQQRDDWDVHKFTPEHLRNLANEGVTEVNMNCSIIFIVFVNGSQFHFFASEKTISI